MAAQSRPVCVLIIDDDPINVSVVSSILRDSGCVVSSATTGEDGLTSASVDQPDVILLDVQMPGMDGFQTAAALHRQDSTSNIPVIMVTSLSSQDDRLRALRAGAIDFLSKPVDPDELRAKVAAHARTKAYKDDMRRRQVELSEQMAKQGGRLQSTLAAFARFVPHEFLSTLGKNDITDVRLGDHVKVDLAILFSDIRSFTSLSEKMTPEQNFAFLNSYLGRMNPFVWENGGFIDKYIGDAIMAIFPGGAASALTAAVAMLAHIPLYNAQRATCGYPPVRIGIGIHRGTTMLGVVGHDRFMQGTAISDAVNLASRLQELTKLYGVALVVSNHVLFDLEDPNRFDYRFLDKLVVRGKEEAASVYEVFDGDSPRVRQRKKESRGEFEKGVYDFHAGQFAEALARFDALSMDDTPDPPVEIYRQRCARALKLAGVEEAHKG